MRTPCLLIFLLLHFSLLVLCREYGYTRYDMKEGLAGTICYYYKGKIYTQENDARLQQLQIADYVVRFKGNSHIEYQYKGMSFTSERIAMLNKDSTNKIVMKIEDLIDDRQQAPGTRVALWFPIVV